MWIRARGSTGPMERPAHFVLVDWRNDLISAIRDVLFVLESIDRVRLG
jgi:hypothetical protein